MSPRHVASTRPRAARHARRLRSHAAARVVALTCVAALSFGATSAATAYVRIENNIATHDVTDQLGERPERPDPDPTDPNAGRPLTFLVMGSDVRDGENLEIGGSADGMRSDTTILMHVSGDRQRVEMVSIPRDSQVQIPACTRSDGTSSSPRETRFNEAFAIGAANGEVADAAACTIKTVEQLTGVYVDGWIVVDFAGFIGMVDALGGIPMCISHEMRAPKANLHVLPGQQVLDGPTALAFARARTGQGLGDGSDTGRLVRQQELLAATATEVLSKNLLTDSAGLYRFLTAATRSLTTDPDTGNIPTLAGLAFSLRNVPSGNIHFMTVPFAPYQPDPNRVVWTDEATEVFANMAADLPIVPEPEPEPEPETEDGSAETEPTEEPAPEPTPTPTRTPGQGSFTPDDIQNVCG